MYSTDKIAAIWKPVQNLRNRLMNWLGAVSCKETHPSEKAVQRGEEETSEGRGQARGRPAIPATLEAEAGNQHALQSRGNRNSCVCEGFSGLG